MLAELMARWQQKHRTQPWPGREPALPDRFRGRPAIDRSKCPVDCRACAAACPTGAATVEASGPAIDLGKCLFCPECAGACRSGAIRFTPEYRLAARRREDLTVKTGETYRLAEALGRQARRLFGRSLNLRQVSAGGCNACESDINVLSTVVYDIGRFGIQVVASPRHADGLIVTGPVTANMAMALKKTYDAVPPPRIVIALGACAISGGPYIGHPEALGGVPPSIPVDLYVPGCPPHPMTILDGLLRVLGRIK
jgi:Ni,Fe-hydrogenase III small subunit/Pyruvate/2-oxoacid:ferredoxin oxidoreductase delta subunit